VMYKARDGNVASVSTKHVDIDLE